jgi:hypothetical protein
MILVYQTNMIIANLSNDELYKKTWVRLRYQPWIWGAFDGFLAIFTPSPYVRRETLSWYLTNFLKKILPEMEKSRNYQPKIVFYEMGIFQISAFLLTKIESKANLPPFGPRVGHRACLRLLRLLLLMLLLSLCLGFGCSERGKGREGRDGRDGRGLWRERLGFGEEGLVKLMQFLKNISFFKRIWK